MQRGEVWFAATPGGDRPVLILTRDPVADRIGSVVVAALTRTSRGVVSELELTPENDGVPTACVATFDNLHTLPRDSFRRVVTQLGPVRMAEVCQVLKDATGC
ncbi:MAG: type II toxin-antitoxin system PemK/MazF family toxin [Actinomycetota bacterium]|nr:type II toxin-antitoxin system PemK/MazF family toxin [Actinomycetota bacterium]